MIAKKLAYTLSTVSAAALLAGCAAYSQGEGMETVTDTATYSPEIPEGTGYFASDSTLPFHAPDFTKISEDDYIPAFEQGMAIQKAEIAAIIDNPAPPTFENTGALSRP